jgi:hypothetical protein
VLTPGGSWNFFTWIQCLGPHHGGSLVVVVRLGRISWSPNPELDSILGFHFPSTRSTIVEETWGVELPTGIACLVFGWIYHIFRLLLSNQCLSQEHIYLWMSTPNLNLSFIKSTTTSHSHRCSWWTTHHCVGMPSISMSRDCIQWVKGTCYILEMNVSTKFCPSNRYGL